MSSSPGHIERLAGLALLFGVVAWAMVLQLPALEPGYLVAGDDHMHVAYANELARIWSGEGRALGWSRLYATGAPIFLLRPPGFYVAVALCHALTGLSIEEAEKLVVVLGFSLYPLTVFAGLRLMGLGFRAALGAGLLALLPISTWGHTVTAYYHLGVHKQLLAILLFPLTVGATWSVLREGRHGALFAGLSAAVLLTHPYIAYCVALLVPVMLVALLTGEERWDARRGLTETALWSVPACLLSLVWLVPLFSSREILQATPFLGVRAEFDVVVCTVAETLRQLFLGGVFDTTRFAGPFGAHEWGWLNNGAYFRAPVLTMLALGGWLIAVVRPRSSMESFLALTGIASLLLFLGPDDVPFLDRLPFASQFQNIHAVFLLDWAAVALGGVCWERLLGWGLSREGRATRRAAVGVVAAVTAGLWLSAMSERTSFANGRVNVRGIYTENGEIALRPTIQRTWAHFKHVVDRIRSSDKAGAVASVPAGNEDMVAYNLLPLMVDRPVYVSAFESVGGVYDLLLVPYRSDLRENLNLQRLFDIRFVVSSPLYERRRQEWPATMRTVHSSPFWELSEVQGQFGAIEPVEGDVVAFVGSEEEWAGLMLSWLGVFRDQGDVLPWVVNLTHAGVDASAIQRLRPFVRAVVVGEGAQVPEGLGEAPTVGLSALRGDPLRAWREKGIGGPGGWAERVPAGFDLEVTRADRGEDRFLARNAGPERLLLLKRAFYRGWEARIDGERTPIFRVSPGLQLILLPPGEHRISWSYRGPNGWPWTRGAFVGGLVAAALLQLRHRRQLRLRGLSPALSPGGWRLPPSVRQVPRLLAATFVLVLAYRTYTEAYLGRPVLITPPAGQYVVDSSLRFYWNSVVGVPPKEQRFRVQIAATPGFEQPLVSKEVSENRAAFDRGQLAKGAYYYRVRLETNGRAYAWTRPARFVIGD